MYQTRFFDSKAPINALVTFFLILFLPNCYSLPGFQDGVAISLGDSNSDGLMDLYISRNREITIIHGEVLTPILLENNVQDFILEQNGTGGFSIISSIDQNLRNELSSWSLTDLNVIINDYNMDGSLDIFIQGLGSVINGVFDQIVFGPDSNIPIPKQVTSVDDEFQAFFLEVFRWLSNPEFFADNAIPIFEERIESRNILVPEYCSATKSKYKLSTLPQLGPITLEQEPNEEALIADGIASCQSQGFHIIHFDEILFKWPVEEQVGLDFSDFNSDAISISNGILKSYRYGEGEFLIDSLDNAIEKLESYLQVQVPLNPSLDFFAPPTRPSILPQVIPEIVPVVEPEFIPPELPNPEPIRIGPSILGRIFVTVGAIVFSSNAGNPNETILLEHFRYGEYIAKQQVNSRRSQGRSNRAAIGETQGRVRREVRNPDAPTFRAATIDSVWPNEIRFSRPMTDLKNSVSLEFNAGWIVGLMYSDYEIFDIGRDDKRTRGLSCFYQRERVLISSADYQLYFQCRASDTKGYEFSGDCVF